MRLRIAAQNSEARHFLSTSSTRWTVSTIPAFAAPPRHGLVVFLSCTGDRRDDDSGAALARTAGAERTRRYGRQHEDSRVARRLWYGAHLAAPPPARSDWPL